MTDLPWPYNLPPFRSSHRAVSPDGQFIAEMPQAREISMSNPTIGTLNIKGQVVIENCNPSFIWSNDSRYLVVPQFFSRFLIFQMQRILLVDVQNKKILSSAESAWYFLPESFDKGRLIVTKNPFRSAQKISWQFPNDLRLFSEIKSRWRPT